MDHLIPDFIRIMISNVLTFWFSIKLMRKNVFRIWIQLRYNFISGSVKVDISMTNQN